MRAIRCDVAANGCHGSAYAPPPERISDRVIASPPGLGTAWTTLPLDPIAVACLAFRNFQPPDDRNV